jgi:antitoxin component of RelBE/YafQ-DinJ toxin-antitoxin module
VEEQAEMVVAALELQALQAVRLLLTRAAAVAVVLQMAALAAQAS